jgi:hypothetical protein
MITSTSLSAAMVRMRDAMVAAEEAEFRERFRAETAALEDTAVVVVVVRRVEVMVVMADLGPEAGQDSKATSVTPQAAMAVSEAEAVPGPTATW